MLLSPVTAAENIFIRTECDLPEASSNKMLHIKLSLTSAAHVLIDLHLAIHTHGQDTSLRKGHGRGCRVDIQFLDCLISEQQAVNQRYTI